MRSRPQFKLPLDLGIAFLGAWSTYPLSQKSGNLFLLRNSTTTVETAIVRAGNKPDEAAISAHLGSASGTITTLYDQVSTNDATQTTVNNQPVYYQMLGRHGSNHANPSGNQKFWHIAGPSLAGRNFSVYSVWITNDRTFAAATYAPPSTPLIGSASFGLYNTNSSRSAAGRLNTQWTTFPFSPMPMHGGNLSVNVGVVRSNATNTRFRINDITGNSATLAAASSNAMAYLMRHGVFYADGCNLLGLLVSPAHTQEEEDAVVASLQNLFQTSPKSKLVLFDGDSITAGHNESGGYFDFRDLSWPYECMTSIDDETVMTSNRAISSSQLVDGTGDPNKDLTIWAPYKLDSWLDASYAKKILVVMAGRNDISVINSAGAGLTTYNRLVSYCQARKAAGWGKIIVVNIQTDKGLYDAGMTAERQDYNSRISANGLTDWDAVVDVASLNWQPGGASDWTTNYQASGIHPNAAGRTLISDAVKPVLQSFL